MAPSCFGRYRAWFHAGGNFSIWASETGCRHRLTFNMCPYKDTIAAPLTIILRTDTWHRTVLMVTVLVSMQETSESCVECHPCRSSFHNAELNVTKHPSHAAQYSRISHLVPSTANGCKHFPVPREPSFSAFACHDLMVWV